MITVFNNTKQTFSAEVNDTFNNRDNRRVSITYGKLRMDTFIPAEQTEDFVKLIKSHQHESNIGEFAAKTRLYHSNKEFLPICVVTKSNGGHFLVLANKLLENERLIHVEYNGVFAFTKDYKKSSHISTIVSFRTDRNSSITLVTSDGQTVRETVFTGTKNGKITRDVKTYKASEYKKYDLKKQGIIKPYRPKRPTHLIFTHTSNLDRAKAIFTKNFTIVGIQNVKELDERVTHYKGIGFTAASLFVDQSREEELSGIDNALLNVVKTNFRLTHLVFEDEFTKNESVKPQRTAKPQNKPPFKKGGKPNNANNKKAAPKKGVKA